MPRKQLRAQFFVSLNGVVKKRERPLTSDQRKAIYDRDNGKCQSCFEPVMLGGNDVSPFMETKSGHVDHKLPISRGGSNHPSNLQMLCMSCNCRKGAD